MTILKPMDQMPYNKTVILMFEDGAVINGFWYDEPLKDFIK